MERGEGTEHRRERRVPGMGDSSNRTSRRWPGAATWEAGSRWEQARACVHKSQRANWGNIGAGVKVQHGSGMELARPGGMGRWGQGRVE